MRRGLTIAALMIALPAAAQSNREFDEIRRVKGMVESLAFDPATFFDQRGAWASIHIRQRGSDWGWPVYSIAIVDGCVVNDAPYPACIHQRLARMVRVPGARGDSLVRGIRKTGAKRYAQVRTALGKAGLEWLEADLQACPGAMAALGKASAARWGPYKDSNGNVLFVMVSHADMIEVSHTVPEGEVTWRGPALEGTPAAWANDLATALEPCWKPATAPAPWRRVRAAD
jgi:hypothetical protein